ncbi:odorant receptor 13a-like [Copidosoma floridanum]|uniref:odorant receptor 13a-like n=1 Tax=Copidosoma floridanum TaxID=29053 RepID=UPI0006C968FD|nr:odorant receptor 13a-like [Copidosoma floridanum]
MTGTAMKTAISFDDYTFLNRWGLTFLGIWKCRRTRGLPHRVHVAVLFGFLFSLLIPQWLDLYILWGNIDANAETFVLNVFTVTALLKLWCFLKVRDVFEEVMGILRNNWKVTMASHEPQHREILLEMAAKARAYTRRYGLLMYSTAFMYFVSPFTGLQHDDLRVRKYPFFGWYYFDRSSGYCYAACYALQVMAGIVVGTGNYAMDSIFFVAMYHSCARLRMLQYDLKRIGDNNTNARIAELVRQHQREIRNSQKLKTIFQGSSFQQLLVSCIIICVIGFKLIIALNERSLAFLIYVAFLFVALLQIFLYCRPGEEIICQSTAIGSAVYQACWCSLDPVSIKKIILIILRSQCPLKMTAGKFFVLSLTNFTKILKTSLSFLSLLRAMYSKSDDHVA